MSAILPGSEAEELAEDVSPFRVDPPGGLEDHGREVVVGPLEVRVVLTVLLIGGVHTARNYAAPVEKRGR